MSRDVRERRCGCLYFEVGPPVLCGRHEKKTRIKEEKALRQRVVERAAELGHDLKRFDEYGNQKGKWTSFCLSCGWLAIAYDEPPPVGDQVSGKVLSLPCAGKRVGGLRGLDRSHRPD